METVHNLIIEDLSKNLIFKIESALIEGLKRKGFEFKNKIKLEQFVKERVSCLDNVEYKQKIYSVDSIPFFLHDYNIQFDCTPVIEDRNIMISASNGHFSFL